MFEVEGRLYGRLSILFLKRFRVDKNLSFLKLPVCTTLHIAIIFNGIMGTPQAGLFVLN
jgi:hypothetical protein